MSWALILILIAVLLGAVGLFVQGAQILFWIGVILLVIGAIGWATGYSRRPPP